MEDRMSPMLLVATVLCAAVVVIAATKIRR